jgi:uncharacterized protein YjdB
MKKIFQITIVLSIMLTGIYSCREDDGVVPINRIDLNKTTMSLAIGSTERLYPTIYPESATDKSIRWFSEDTSIATVDNDGLVKGESVGVTVIRLTDANNKIYLYPDASCAVSVHEKIIPVTGVSLGKTTTAISVNSVEELNYTVAPIDATNKNVTWKSNDVSIVIVDSNGKITGVAVGKATVTVTSEDGQFSSSCVVTVQNEPIAVTGVTLDKTKLTVTTGGTGQLTAAVAPSNATNKDVTWSSGDQSVATVNNEGVVTGVSAGTVGITVTADDGGFNYTCIVTVQEDVIRVTGVTLDKTKLTVTTGETGQLTASVAPSNATNKNVTWSSGDLNVATVNDNGVVTGVSTGSAIVTATTADGNFVSNCIVTVKEADVLVTGVTLDRTTLDIYIDDVEELTAEVAPANATNKDVSWSSSATSVATVNSNGVVTGVSEGTATITVTAADGGFTSTCEVNVMNEMGDVTSTGWSTPAVNSYEYSMTYVAQVAFRDVLTTNTDVEVAAYVGNELRGYAKLVYDSRLNVYLVHLTIYSNSAGNETVSLKAYNPQKQRIYENCKEFAFQGNTSLGSASEILNCMP